MQSRIAVLLAVIASTGATADRAALQQLYRDGQWFDLKEKIDRTGAPAFYRGAVALAFNQPSVAEKEFATLFRKAPASWEAREAHRLLSVWCSFTGQYQRSLEEYVAFAKLASGHATVERELRERRLWSRHAPLAVKSRRYSKVRFTTKDGDLFLPISINGAEARYLIDTGANTSLISESEAERVGMTIEEAQGLHIHDVSGSSSYRVALAKDLVLGNFRLANVMFVVVPDDRMPFVNLPAGSRGILGLPLLFAWQTIRWNRDGVFEVGFEPDAHRRSAPTLCFSGEGPHLVTKGEFTGHPVAMVVDTGAMKSRLLPFFATAFGTYVRDGMQSAATLHGVTGSATTRTRVLPEAEFRVGGLRTILQPAELIDSRSLFGDAPYHVWLGSDLLQQANQVTIDFRTMQLTLR